MKIDYNTWCKKCKNYEYDISRGIICGLTHAKPDFLNDCHKYDADENKIHYFETKEKITLYQQF